MDSNARRLVAVGVVALAVVGAFGAWQVAPSWITASDEGPAASETSSDPPAWTIETANRSRCGDRCVAVTLLVTNTGATATNVTVDVTVRPERRPTPVWSETIGAGPVGDGGVVERRARIGFGPLGVTRLQNGNCTLTITATVRWNGPESPGQTTASVENVCQTLFVR